MSHGQNPLYTVWYAPSEDPKHIKKDPVKQFDHGPSVRTFRVSQLLVRGVGSPALVAARTSRFVWGLQVAQSRSYW